MVANCRVEGFAREWTDISLIKWMRNETHVCSYYVYTMRTVAIQAHGLQPNSVDLLQC